MTDADAERCFFSQAQNTVLHVPIPKCASFAKRQPTAITFRKEAVIMSNKLPAAVQCKHCQHTIETELWETINTATDPELKAAVRDRTAFLFECPECSEKSYLDYGFLYHQPEDRILIQYATDDDTIRNMLACLKAPKENNPRAPFMDAEYIIRLVRSQDRLTEKLRILDDGLDDRIMEIYKALALLNYDSEHPDKNNTEVYYFHAADGSHQLQVFIDKKYECSSLFNQKMYQNLVQQFSPKLPPIRKDWPLIDEKWAMHLLTEDDE